MILVLAGMAVVCSALVIGYGIMMALLFLVYKATGGKLNFRKWKNICGY